MGVNGEITKSACTGPGEVLVHQVVYGGVPDMPSSLVSGVLHRELADLTTPTSLGDGFICDLLGSPDGI